LDARVWPSSVIRLARRCCALLRRAHETAENSAHLQALIALGLHRVIHAPGNRHCGRHRARRRSNDEQSLTREIRAHRG
jgi:hypothetical protein